MCRVLCCRSSASPRAHRTNRSSTMALRVWRCRPNRPASNPLNPTNLANARAPHREIQGPANAREAQVRLHCFSSPMIFITGLQTIELFGKRTCRLDAHSRSTNLAAKKTLFHARQPRHPLAQDHSRGSEWHRQRHLPTRASTTALGPRSATRAHVHHLARHPRPQRVSVGPIVMVRRIGENSKWTRNPMSGLMMKLVQMRIHESNQTRTR